MKSKKKKRIKRRKKEEEKYCQRVKLSVFEERLV